MQNHNSSKPFFIIGHRGAAGEKFENSLSGFKHAASLNIDAIELDIRQHDQELWVIHDDALERLTGETGHFKDIKNPSTLRLKNGEAIPRLREVLDLVWGKIPLNIEIKSAETVDLLLQQLSEYPALQESNGVPWILISSFDHQQLLELRQLSCPWPLAPITLGLPINAGQLIRDLKPYSWHMDNEYPNINFVKSIQSSGVKVMMYTVNSETTMLALKKAGIDGVFTDFPSTFKALNETPQE